MDSTRLIAFLCLLSLNSVYSKAGEKCETQGNIVIVEQDGQLCPNECQADTLAQELTEKFFRLCESSYGDSFDFITFFSYSPVKVREFPKPEIFGFHTLVTNLDSRDKSVTGLGCEFGDPICGPGVDRSILFYPDGRTEGRLQSVVVKSSYLEQDSVLSTLAQEIGHRWLAHIKLNAESEDILLGRGDPDNPTQNRAHWSFFFNTPSKMFSGTTSSVMEGNIWERNLLLFWEFRSIQEGSEGYSALDLYLMGVLSSDLCAGVDQEKPFDNVNVMVSLQGVRNETPGEHYAHPETKNPASQRLAIPR